MKLKADTKKSASSLVEHPEIDKEINREIFMVRYGFQLKVLVILVVILLAVGFGGYVIYKLMVPPPECTLDENCPSGSYCHDQKCVAIPQEQPPADLAVQVLDTYVFSSVPGKVDLLATVRDPDSRWGLDDFEYTFTVKDSNGVVVGTWQDHGYLLPGEEKYLIKVGVPVTGTAAVAEVAITPKSWIKSPELQPPKVEVKNISYAASTNLGKSQLQGRLINSSAYNFEEVEVMAVLLDTAGRPVGVNYTTLNALFAGEERDFTLVWFGDVAGPVAGQNVRAEADIYDTRNFLLQLETEPEKFQRYDEPEVPK